MIFFFFPDSPLFFERVRETREHEKTKEIKNVIVKDKEKFQFRSNKNPRNSKNEIWGVFEDDVIDVATLKMFYFRKLSFFVVKNFKKNENCAILVII